MIEWIKDGERKFLSWWRNNIFALVVERESSKEPMSDWVIVKDREKPMGTVSANEKGCYFYFISYGFVSTFDFKIGLRNKTLKQSSTIMTHQLVVEFGTECRLLSVAIFESKFVSKISCKVNNKI